MNCLMDPQVYCKKGSSKKYDPFSTNGSYMVYRGCELSELFPISLLNTAPKNMLALMF